MDNRELDKRTTKTKTCVACKGTGLGKHQSDWFKSCAWCKGWGFIEKQETSSK